MKGYSRWCKYRYKVCAKNNNYNKQTQPQWARQSLRFVFGGGVHVPSLEKIDTHKTNILQRVLLESKLNTRTSKKVVVSPNVCWQVFSTQEDCNIWLFEPLLISQLFGHSVALFLNVHNFKIKYIKYCIILFVSSNF